MTFATGVIGTFKTGTYAVTRTATGSQVKGRYVTGSPTTFNITASVQPISGRDLKDLKEGQRAEDFRAVFTGVELRTRDSADDPDVIQINGDHYRVNSVKFRQVIGKYYRAIVQRIEYP